MFGILIFIHSIIGILLIVAVLVQSGRSGGLTETFGGAAESIFGTKTNVFMVRLTTTLAALFIISCLTLAYLSKQQSLSLMEKAKVSKPKEPTKPKAPEEVNTAEQKEPVRVGESKSIITTNKVNETGTTAK
jgi:preprotein translocase subunit SecG